jgi:hypothetical protein
MHPRPIETVSTHSYGDRTVALVRVSDTRTPYRVEVRVGDKVLPPSYHTNLQAAERCVARHAR